MHCNDVNKAWQYLKIAFTEAVDALAPIKWSKLHGSKAHNPGSMMPF